MGTRKKQSLTYNSYENNLPEKPFSKIIKTSGFNIFAVFVVEQSYGKNIFTGLCNNPKLFIN